MMNNLTTSTNHKSMFLFTAYSNKNLLTISMSDVIYIECKKNYCEFVMKRNTITIRGTVSDFENKFSLIGFIRIHSGFLVNHKFISEFRKKNILLETGEILPVSRGRYNESVKKWYEYSGVL